MKTISIISVLALSIVRLFGQGFVENNVTVGDTSFGIPVPASYVAIEKDAEWAKAYLQAKEHVFTDERRNNTFILAMQTPERFAVSKKNGEITGGLDCWAVYPNFSAKSRMSLEQFATLNAQAESAFTKLDQTAKMSEFLGIKPSDFTDEQVRRQFATMTKPMFIGKSSRTLLTVAKDGGAYTVQAWVLVNGKFLFLYMNKSQDQLTSGISEMHAWLKEIEDKTSATLGAEPTRVSVVSAPSVSPGMGRKESPSGASKEFEAQKMQAETGDAFAQYNVGVAYANGDGVAQDHASAVKWFMKAAEKDITEAQYNLGICYANGWGVTKDDSEAAKWFRKASDKGDADAQFRLGNLYDNGRGVTMDDVEAVKWYRSAAIQGHAMAQHDLGIMYARGEGVPKKDSVEAHAWFILAAYSAKEARQDQEGIAIRKTGETYEKVLTLESKSRAQARAIVLSNLIDEKKAFKEYMLKGMEQGIDWAQFNLGYCYANGVGVEKDAAEAVNWYRKAAEQGFANAQNHLGNHYADGVGVKKDFVEAVFWYRKAAEGGNAVAQYNLGNSYYVGEGVEKDIAQAASWYRKAAEQGYAMAQFNLANSYANGEGLAKDFVQAVKWYRIAASQGHDMAQYNLGVRYANGEGLEKDKVEAYAYWTLAAATNQRALNSLPGLENSLSIQEIAAGKKRAKELQKEIADKQAVK